MTSRETTTYGEKRGSIPAEVSLPLSAVAPFLTGDEERDDVTHSGGYTPEEEALVEERLKNLGYL